MDATRWIRFGLLAALTTSAGCSVLVDGSKYTGNASMDAANDAGMDAANDASMDAANDASMDAANDASMDAGVDSAVDAGECAIDSDCALVSEASAVTCDAGHCVISRCNAGFADCDGMTDNGCETDTNGDPAHCGACDYICEGGSTSWICASSTCAVDTCEFGFADCNDNSTDGCEADLRAPEHCGSCALACPSSTPVCNMMSPELCVESCSAPSMLCGTSCIDTQNDAANCGSCGHICEGGSASWICALSSCAVDTCEPGFADCNGNPTDGCESDLVHSDLSCGACGAACPAGCFGGLCNPIVDISYGLAAACAVHANGDVFCWGTNDRGQLGLDDFAPQARPTPVMGLAGGTLSASAISIAGESPGQTTACAVLTDGGLACWGAGGYGTLGDGRIGVFSATPVRVISTDTRFLSRTFKSVAMGYETACAVDTLHSLWCWGRNTAGELGVPTSTSWRPTAGLVMDSVAQVSLGARYACALTMTGSVLCWGLNANGNLGDGTVTSRYLARPTSPPIDHAVAIGTGYYHACALHSDHSVSCWGVGGDGQLGQGVAASSSVPRAATELGTDVDALSLGSFYTFVTSTTGVHRGVGRNLQGQLGSGDLASPALTAVNPISIGPTARIIGGRGATGALEAGRVRSWGDDRFGQLGRDDGLVRMMPVAVAGASISEMTLGQDSGCFTAGGQGYCVGRGANQQLGNGSYDPTSSAVAPTLTGLVSARAGSRYACGVRRTSVSGVISTNAYCWGDGTNGSLGDGTSTSHSTPAEVLLIGDETRVVTSGDGHTCALQTRPGPVYCWGNNDSGQLGNGMIGGFNATPGVVTGISDAMELVTGTYHTCALRVTGEVACWGRGSSGQLGNGSSMPRSAAVAVSMLTNVIALAAGNYHTCAIVGASSGATQGSVYCWGDNSQGAIGDTTSAGPHYSPFLVSTGVGVTDFKALGSGAGHTCALRASGPILCWGKNEAGQLGDGTRVTQRAPVLSHPMPDAIGLSSGSRDVSTQCAWDSHGNATCWGYDPEGMMGSGQPLYEPTPGPMFP